VGYVLPLVVIAALSLGCGNAPNAEPEPGRVDLKPSTGDKDRAPQKPDKPKEADRSLTTVEYMARGMPDPTGTWSGPEYNKAAEVLNSLVTADAGLLPRHQSPKSGEMFARMTDKANLKPLHDPKRTIEDRLKEGNEIFGGANAIVKVYARGYSSGIVNENYELMGFLLRASVAMTEIVHEYYPTIPRDDPKRAVRVGGVAKMRRGIAILIYGASWTFKDPLARPSAVQKARVIDYLKETLPHLMHELPVEWQKKLTDRFKSIRDQEQDKVLQASLDELIKVIPAPKEPLFPEALPALDSFDI
jgi:hypothetical protein